MNIQYRKREKTPKYTTEQQIKTKKRNRKLDNQLFNTKSLQVIDNEKYFALQVITSQEILDTTQTSKKHAQKLPQL